MRLFGRPYNTGCRLAVLPKRSAKENPLFPIACRTAQALGTGLKCVSDQETTMRICSGQLVNRVDSADHHLVIALYEQLLFWYCLAFSRGATTSSLFLTLLHHDLRSNHDVCYVIYILVSLILPAIIFLGRSGSSRSGRPNPIMSTSLLAMASLILSPFRHPPVVPITARDYRQSVSGQNTSRWNH